MSSQLGELMDAFLAGELDAAERARLEELLKADPSAREELCAQQSLHQALTVLLEAPAGDLAVRKSVLACLKGKRSQVVRGLAMAVIARQGRAGSSPLRRFYPVMAAAVVLLGLALAWQLFRVRTAGPAEVSTAFVFEVNGSAERVTSRGVVRVLRGDVLEPGIRLLTGASGRLKVGYRGEETLVELAANTVCSWPDAVDGAGKRLHLERGVLTAAVAPQPAGRPLAVVTPHARAEVVGTRFTLSADSGRTALEVMEGLVRLANPDGSAAILVPGGQSAEAAPNRAPRLAGTPPAIPEASRPRPAAVPGTPELPRVSLHTVYVPLTGAKRMVRAGDSLQAALDAARPGDTLVLEAGAVFSGPFLLPNKPDQEWIHVQSSQYAALPKPGSRVSPADAVHMPKLETAAGSVITTAPGAHHFRFVGVEIRPAAGRSLHNLINLGAAAEAKDSSVPHHLIFDRCFLHGDSERGARRGIALNSGSTAVVDSWLSDFKQTGAYTQAIASWSGPGPFKIENNHLEAVSQGILFGGAPPNVPGQTPADVEIRRNHFFKPLSWKAPDPAAAGPYGPTQCHLQLANVQRLLVEGNVMENCWSGAEKGFAVVVNSGAEGFPAAMSDLTFRLNLVQRCAGGLDLGRAERIGIRDNLFEEMSGGPRWAEGGARFVMLGGAPEDVALEHNTAFCPGPALYFCGTDPIRSRRLVFRDNLVPGGTAALEADNGSTGVTAHLASVREWVFAGNVFPGRPKPEVSSGNHFPGSTPEVGFVSFERGDWHLAPTSPFRKAGADGKDIGCDLEALEAATRGVR